MKIDIKDKDKKRYNLKKDFSMIEFDVVNPTSSPFVINLFDTTTLTSIPTSPTGGYPSNVLSVIPAPTFLQLIAYCPINNFVYVCAPALGRVFVIDCATDTPVTSIPTNVSPSGITYNPTNNCMYVTNNGSNSVVQISCLTNTVVNTVNTGANPYGMAYDSVNNRIYIANTVGGSISVLDCATAIIITTIILPLSTPLLLSYNSNNGTIYVTSQLFSNVFVIDCATNSVGLPIPVGTNPTGIDYNPISNTMYVCNIASNTISVIDCATATVIATINTIISGGVNPLSITYYPLNNLMYVGFIGNVLILDCNTNTFLSTNIVTGVNNYGIAYNYIKNSMYVSANTVGVFDINSPPILPYITSSFNYNEFIQDIIYNPVWVERIVFYSQSQTTFNQIINNTTKDANGNLMNNPYIPSMSVGTSQFQSGIGKLDFPNAELVLGVNQYLANFTVAPFSEIKLILIYKQLQKIELLTEKSKMCDRIITTRNPIQTVREKDNKVADSKYIAFDFIPFVDLVEKEITPFSISNLVKPLKKIK